MIAGERPLWVIVGTASLIVVWVLSGYVRPSRHERSIRNPRGRHWE